jgi:hypothetical protein
MILLSMIAIDPAAQGVTKTTSWSKLSKLINIMCCFTPVAKGLLYQLPWVNASLSLQLQVCVRGLGSPSDYGGGRNWVQLLFCFTNTGKLS